MVMNIPAPVAAEPVADAETDMHLKNIYGYLTVLSGTLNRILPTLEDEGERERLAAALEALEARVKALEDSYE